MNCDQAKPGSSVQLCEEDSCLPNFYEENYSNIDRLLQAESQNQTSHETMQLFSSTSAYSTSQENNFVKTQREDINLNLRPTFSFPVDIVTYQENQQIHIEKAVYSKTSELLEHTYARSSHEENDSDQRLERLKMESNAENMYLLQQNYSKIISNKSFFKESSYQAAADSSLRLSEGNSSFPCTCGTSSDLNELFEHTYARPSHEETDFERRLEPLKTESNLQNLNDSINVNKSLLNESSCQTAADSFLRLSEDNSSFSRTCETSSDLDELFEHTYAQPSNEENDFERRLERLKTESNLQNQNDSNNLNTLLLNESSCQAAAESFSNLSEDNSLFSGTCETSSELDELFEHTYARPSNEETDFERRLEQLKTESNLQNQNDSNNLNKSLLNKSSYQATADYALGLLEDNGLFPLFEHTYARPSHEETDSERRLERLKTESNVETMLCSLQHNDSSNLNTPLLNESSCQAAADSILRLSEGNGSSPYKCETSSDSDADLLIHFVNSTFEENSNSCVKQNNQTNFTQSESLSSISLNEGDNEKLKVLSGQQEPSNNLHQTASNTSFEPFGVLQTLNERRLTPDTETTLLENSQPSTSFDIPETRASNNYNVSPTTEEQSSKVALIRNLIDGIVEVLALSPLGQIFEAARNSTAEVEDVEVLRNFYRVLLETMLTAQVQNITQPSCSRVLEVEDNQHRKVNYPKTKKMTIAKIMRSKKMKSWKNVIIKRYLNNDSLPQNPVLHNDFPTNTATCSITRENVQPCANESRMTLRPRNTVRYQEDSDSNLSSECFARTENKKLSSSVAKNSTSTNAKKIDPSGRISKKKLVLENQRINCKKTIQTILSGDEKWADKNFLGTTNDIENTTTSSEVVEKFDNMNHNIIWPKDSIDGTSQKNFVPLGEARNGRPNILSVLIKFKHDYLLFRRQVMRDFNIQAQTEKNSKKIKVNNFNSRRAHRQSIKLKVSRFFNGFYGLSSNITEPNASGKWTYRVCQVDKNTTK